MSLVNNSHLRLHLSTFPTSNKNPPTLPPIHSNTHITLTQAHQTTPFCSQIPKAVSAPVTYLKYTYFLLSSIHKSLNSQILNKQFWCPSNYQLKTMGKTAVRKTAWLPHNTKIFLGSVSYVLRQESAIYLLPSQWGKLECHWQAYGKKNKGETNKEKSRWVQENARCRRQRGRWNVTNKLPELEAVKSTPAEWEFDSIPTCV